MASKATGDQPAGDKHVPPPMDSTVDTTHLQLMRGESKLFGATRAFGCGCVYQLEVRGMKVDMACPGRQSSSSSSASVPHA